MKWWEWGFMMLIFALLVFNICLFSLKLKDISELQTLQFQADSIFDRRLIDLEIKTGKHFEKKDTLELIGEHKDNIFGTRIIYPDSSESPKTSFEVRDSVYYVDEIE